MNKPNNKRSRDTDEAIVRAAFGVMVGKNKPVSKITVREICELAQVNRSTFYAHYTDVYDLFEKVEQQIAKMCADTVLSHVQSGGIQAAMESVFAFVAGYKEFYQLYKETNRLPHLIEVLSSPFKEQLETLQSRDLGYGIPGEMAYHYRFFTAGVSSILEHWLDTGCQETPHELFEILVREYGPHSLLNTWLNG